METTAAKMAPGTLEVAAAAASLSDYLNFLAHEAHHRYELSFPIYLTDMSDGLVVKRYILNNSKSNLEFMDGLPTDGRNSIPTTQHIAVLMSGRHWTVCQFSCDETGIHDTQNIRQRVKEPF